MEVLVVAGMLVVTAEVVGSMLVDDVVGTVVVATELVDEVVGTVVVADTVVVATELVVVPDAGTV
jgi:hypothetical protein